MHKLGTEQSKETQLHPIRVKNQYSTDFDARGKFGYRSILANYKFSMPQCWHDLVIYDSSHFLPHIFKVGQSVKCARDGLTGSIYDCPGADDYVVISVPNSNGSNNDQVPTKIHLDCQELIDLNRQHFDQTLDEWTRKHVPYSLQHLPNLRRLVTRLQFSVLCNREFLSQPVKFIVEVQFVLSEYMRMRRKTHLWYKLSRTETPEVSDFFNYAGITRKSSFLLQALEQNDTNVARYFANCPAVAASQVVGCRTSVGRTVLHLIALHADGRFNALLPNVLVVKSEDVDVWSFDAYGASALELAIRKGNQEASRQFVMHPSFQVACNAAMCFVVAHGDGRYNHLLDKLLAQPDADVHEPCKSGAATWIRSSIVKQDSTVDVDSWTPLTFALASDNRDAVQRMRRHASFEQQQRQ